MENVKKICDFWEDSVKEYNVQRCKMINKKVRCNGNNRECLFYREYLEEQRINSLDF